MECPSPSELFAALASSPDSAESGAVLRHSRECAACAARVRAVQALRREAGRALAAIAPQKGLDCPSWEELAAFVDGFEGASLGGHLRECESCLLQAVALRARELPKPGGAPGAEVVLRVVRENRASRPAHRFWTWVPVYAAALALSGLAVFVAVRGVSRRQAPGVVAPLPVQVASDRGAPVPPAGRRAADAPPPLTPFQPPASERAPIFRSPPPAQNSVSTVFLYPSPAGMAALPLPSSQTPVLFSNGRYALRLHVGATVWLYVFQSDASGRISVLFPNAAYQTAANPLTAAAATTLPRDGNWYQLDNTIGTETLYVVYAMERLEICERLLKLAPAADVQPEVQSILQDLARTSSPPGTKSRWHTVITQRFEHRGSGAD